MTAPSPATATGLLARRIQHLTEEIDDLNERIAEAVEVSTPGLLDVRGVGPDSAAALLISAGDNPERLASEASFAALCGTSPVEASSGKTQRRRLNRGGDRQANAALYRIVLSRLRWDDRSRDYLRRRLKRYVAREIYRLIVPRALRPASQDAPRTPVDIHRGINLRAAVARVLGFCTQPNERAATAHN
ncbi:transposase [Streptomyces sp. NPDC048269]|uniref:transposase n=1 Tax=Streptomyces sp. NPDC048269 TaxID=3155753 RepID=UPI00342DA39E